MRILSRTEELVLATVWRLQENAYGVAINQAINKSTNLSWKFGSIYTPLGRLVEKGLLKAIEGEPTPERGGRRKLFFRLTDEGKSALIQIQKIHNAVWMDLPSLEKEES